MKCELCDGKKKREAGEDGKTRCERSKNATKKLRGIVKRKKTESAQGEARGKPMPCKLFSFDRSGGGAE